MVATIALATEDQFTATRFHSARDKMLTVNATVRFLKSGLAPAKFTKRAYYFFHQTLSMSAEYDIDGFRYRHFSSEDSKRRFLAEVRDRIDSHANLDPERNSDMAALFLDDAYGLGEGPYGSLLR